VGKSRIENLEVFNHLPRHRIYDLLARDLQEMVRDGEQLSLLYTGRSMTVVAFIIPITDPFISAVSEMGAKITKIPVSSLKERHILRFLREQDRGQPLEVLTVTLSGIPVVYIVPFNENWRGIVADHLGLNYQGERQEK